MTKVRLLGGDGEIYSEPPADAKVFVGNLTYEVDSERLAHLFEQAGIVEIAEVIYNRQTDQSRGFGFVTMSTVEEADKAVHMFNRYELNGRLLTVNKAAARGSQPEIMSAWNRFSVGLWMLACSSIGETGSSCGFGSVTMSTEAELNDAIAKLDGQDLDGRTIRVNIAEERPRRTF